jgi:beta-lactamase regulating signal transducer with metallopeptidase domain
MRTLVMVVAAWAALRLLRVTNVVAQKIAWTIVLATALAMPFLVRQHWMKLPAISIPASWLTHARASEPAFQVAAAPAEEPASYSTTPAINVVTTPAPASALAVASPTPHRWTLPQLRSLIIRAYLNVAGILLLRLLFGLVLAFRVWYRAEPASVLVDPRADVRFSHDIRTPVTIGLGIVLPKAFENWNRRRLHAVLAHERAHVRQADFYLQLLARLHTAVFWFSPAAWWIQNHLSDLGEAISDYAAISETDDAPSYAELLLEVAAIPRQPLFAVPMARSSRIERRIDRILTDGLFRRAFVEHRGRALTVGAILPVILAISSSLLAVHAAEVAPVVLPAMHVATQETPPLVATPAPPAVQLARSVATPSPSGAPVVVVPSVPVSEIKVPVESSVNVRLDTASIVAIAQAAASSFSQDSHTYYSDSDQESYMVVDGGQTHMFNVHGGYSEMESLSKKVHGNYILAERDGKYYVIDDPTMMEQTRKLFAPMEELGRQQEALGAQQEKLGEEQEKLGEQQEKVHIETPDMSKEIAELQEAVKKLQDLEKSKTVTQSELADIQGRIGGIEGRLGAMQGQMGAQQGDLGRQQGELGRQQGELGRKQGELGRQQGRLAREASRQISAMIDQAFKEGKAKPVQ